MRLVQGRRVVDRGDAGKAAAQESAIHQGADRAGIGRGQDVEADHLPTLLPQAAHQRLAEMAGAAGDQRSEEHTSELTLLMRISYAVFCLKKTINTTLHKGEQ